MMYCVKIAALIATVLTVQACTGGGGTGIKSAPDSRIVPVSKANPASVYCAELGGRLEMRQEQAGEAGYCQLPDGSTVAEWKLYRDHNPL